MGDNHAIVRLEGDLSSGPRFIAVTVDGKPLVVRSASIELTPNGCSEVVLRLPAETVNLSLRSTAIQHARTAPAPTVSYDRPPVA